jgi:hypothetical protein
VSGEKAREEVTDKDAVNRLAVYAVVFVELRNAEGRERVCEEPERAEALRRASECVAFLAMEAFANWKVKS